MKPTDCKIGDKVKILGCLVDYHNRKIGTLTEISESYYIVHIKDDDYCNTTELKPCRPSRTGTRDPNTGRFVSKCMRAGWCELCKEVHNNPLVDDSMEKWIKSIKNNPDSKQRNYQKKDQQWFDHDYIIKSLERIEKKIDELGRKV